MLYLGHFFRCLYEKRTTHLILNGEGAIRTYTVYIIFPSYLTLYVQKLFLQNKVWSLHPYQKDKHALKLLFYKQLFKFQKLSSHLCQLSSNVETMNHLFQSCIVLWVQFQVFVRLALVRFLIFAEISEMLKKNQLEKLVSPGK